MANPVPPRPSSGTKIEAGSGSLRFARSGKFRVVAVGAVVAGIFFTINGAGLWVAAIPVIAVVVLAVLAGPDIVAAFGWRPATLELSQDPVGLGSSPTVTYRRLSRRPHEVGDFTVTCRVVCEERVEYRHGTSTEVDTADVFQQTFTGHGSGTAQGLEASAAITVPSWAGSPSFDLRNNAVRWYLVASVDGSGVPSDDQHFPIIVAPYLEPEVRNEVGDR